MVIGHYMHGLWQPGGVATYLQRVTAGLEARGHTNLYFDSAITSDDGATLAVSTGPQLAGRARAAGADLVHMHLGLAGSTGGVPVVRTHHGHHAYCPSATQYLPGRSLPCNRPYGLGRCTWGHLIDHCGSVRPRRFLEDFRRYHQEHEAAATTSVIIANSEFVRGRLVRDGYPPDRIRVILNPAPASAPVGPMDQGDDARFLFLGRIVPQKGLDWLIRSMATTASGCQLDVCGSGPQEESTRRQVVELGLESRVHFHGWVSAGRVAELIARCRAVVVPSVWHEPAGLSAVEAAAAGRAVIAARTGGLPEAVEDNVTGLLVGPRNSGGLAAALDLLASDPALAARLGEAGRVAAQGRFSIDRHLDRLIPAYEDALAAPTK